MLRRAFEKIVYALLANGIPIFLIFIFVLAELPVLPLGSYLGGYAMVLNASAVMAVAVSLHVALARKNWATYFVLARKLGLHRETEELAAEFFQEPFRAWSWLLLDFTLLWLATIMAFGSILYNLSEVSSLYKPFDGDVTLVSVFLFVLNEALKGAFFDVMEVFHLNIGGDVSVDVHAHPFLGCILVAFRMAITIAFVELIVTYAGMYSSRKDDRLLQLSKLALGKG